MSTPFANFQYGIYLDGAVNGKRPQHPMAWDALEREATERLAPGPRGYLNGGSGTEDTMRENLDAFRRRRIVPRMLRDVETRSLERTVLNTAMPAPLLIAPIGVQSIVHPQGELATARAAASTGLTMIASTASSYTMEAIAEAGDGATPEDQTTSPRWYQLYWPRGRELARSLVERAEAAGYQAIVVTLDTWLLGWRPRDLQEAYLPFLESVGIANYLSDPVFRSTLEKTPEEDPMAAVGQFVGVFSNPSVTWDDLAYLRECTSLPIVLKGILSPDDAREAVARGMDGIIVSNHGGRQVDGAIGALDALPGIVDAAGAELTVLFDSGVRCGADVFKALALGARAVCVGRPVMWGLAVGGEDGARLVLQSLLAELDLTLALSGLAHVDQIGRAALTPLH
ncbi:Lactate 2-monooxygenase [Paraconexibacter sp. AEG42_29]|uniref:Lactate 2-monooxygenase n=1 Tax=Paraconexibacter sp. AEG42_29 TaxID=2997339 RepID=A0AAU7B1W5_9ACTN